LNFSLRQQTAPPIVKMAATSKNFPSVMAATSQDIEMMLAAQCHIGARK
jgi:hypothetical protein